MADLLFIKFSPYSDELFYPWEQHPVILAELLIHLHRCVECCSSRTGMFESAMQQTRVTVGCADGRAASERLLAEKANWKSWKE